MIEFDEKSIEKAIENLKDREKKHKAISNYAEIMKINGEEYIGDVSRDTKFQTTFNAFYKVRRNLGWREKYYKLFEDVRTSGDLSFESILKRLYNDTHRVEASFASKMLATLNPDMPIWDSVVLAKLELARPQWSKCAETRLQNAVKRYGEIVDKFKSISDENKQYMIGEFDRAFEQFRDFSDTKKIDFIIWQMRDSNKKAEA